MPPRDVSYLLDILAAARLVRQFMQGADRTRFEADLALQSSIIHRIMLIGEVTKRLSDEFRRNHAEVPWSDMARMRDFLIHSYDQVDVGEIWRVAIEDVPDLIRRIEPLVPPDTD